MPVVMVVGCAIAMLWGGGIMMRHKDAAPAPQTTTLNVETNAERTVHHAMTSMP